MHCHNLHYTVPSCCKPVASDVWFCIYFFFLLSLALNLLRRHRADILDHRLLLFSCLAKSEDSRVWMFSCIKVWELLFSFFLRNILLDSWVDLPWLVKPGGISSCHRKEILTRQITICFFRERERWWRFFSCLRNRQAELCSVWKKKGLTEEETRKCLPFLSFVLLVALYTHFTDQIIHCQIALTDLSPSCSSLNTVQSPNEEWWL